MFTFYIKTALRNIINNKRQAIIFSLGVIFSTAIFLGLAIWSTTAKNLASEDFLEAQDFEIKIRSYDPEFIPAIENWLNNESLVESTSELFYNIALFNAESKNDSYRFFPEDQQDNLTDPISLTNLCLFSNNSIPRIANQFVIEGEFNLSKNEILISQNEAQRLEEIFQKPIVPGMKINVSIARRGPERGEDLLSDCDLKNFYNVTVKGIYRIIPTISSLQDTFAPEFISDSIIFLKENMNSTDMQIMKNNGFEPVIMVKCVTTNLKKDGINQILPKLDNLADKLKVNYLTAQPTILRTPTEELQNSYTLARSTIFLMAPIFVIGLLLSILTTNIILENRENEFKIIQDRGGQKWQIISLIFIEFFLMSVIALTIGVLLSFIVASVIPSFSSEASNWQKFANFLVKSSFPYNFAFYLILLILIPLNTFTIIKVLTILNRFKEDRNKEEIKRINEKAQLYLSGGLSLVLFIAVLITGINLYLSQGSNRNFNFEQITNCNQQYLLFIGLLMSLILFSSILMVRILGKIKFIYKKLIPKNNFFINNTFQKGKKKFTILLSILLLLNVISFFSINVQTNLENNYNLTTYYNNGADLRIQTSYSDINFSDNISRIEGIDEAMTVLQTNGKMIYSQATIYGVDPIKYNRIGRWLPHSFSNYDANYNLLNLNSTINGILVSENMKNKLNLSIGDTVTITGLPNGSYINRFSVSGFINSAPGLGLSSGQNIELSQPNPEYVIVNKRLLTNFYNISYANLFFAKVLPGYPINEIKNELESFPTITAINPKVINSFNIGRYVYEYVPNVRTFQLILLFFVNIIGGLLVISSLDFLLSKRHQEFAIMKIFGNNTKNLFLILLSEMGIMYLSSFLTSVVVGLPFAILSFYLHKAIYVTHEIVPFKYSLNISWLLIYQAILIVFSLISIIPFVYRFKHKKIAYYLMRK